MNQRKVKELILKFFGKGGMPLRKDRLHVKLRSGQVICDDARRSAYRRAKKDYYKEVTCE